jgi:uncharacterized protein (TIGR03382 family)
MVRAMIIGVMAMAGAAHAQVWVEQGDAGSLPGTAQHTMGVGPLREIQGTLFGQEDMYCIRIFDVHQFRATTVTGAAFDTQLWLFNRDGTGVSFNDDSFGSLQSTLTGQFVSSPGTYFIAITQYDNDALNGGGAEMWLDGPFGDERAVDGAGGAIAGWSGSSDNTLKNYSIFLRGATFCEVPTPGSLAVLGLAGLAGFRRRR